ncbi:MAG TPA: hypothetical protein VH249_20525 [Xanthobacteraceae bacterium]|jgi:hypothetical protein|nr:hypothetical protein [Xanthobacteraceae bacterium]
MADIGVTPQAEAAVDEPRSTAWRLGGFAVAGGLALSTLVHLALVGTVVFVTPKLLGPAPVNSMTVDIVSPDEVAELSKKAAESSASQPSAPGEPAQPTPPPQPQAEPVQAPSSPGLDAFPMPRPPAVPQTAAPTLGEAARLAQLLGLPTPMAGAAAGGGPSEVQANLSPEEIAAFSAHVQSCWAAPAGLVAAPKLQVVIRVSLRPDGGLTTSPALLAAPASAQGPVLVKAAMRALQKCQPYMTLPAGKYDEWRLLDLRFSADGMASVSPVPSDQRTPRQPG